MLTKLVSEVPTQAFLSSGQIQFVDCVSKEALLGKIVQVFHIVVQSDAH